MPTELVRRIDLDKLYPPFVAVVLDALGACRARGHDYVATYGLRTWQEQAQLRSAWLSYRAGRGPPVGMAAQPGYSAHQYGFAVDFCADADEARPGLQPDWTHPAYEVLGEEMRARGLVWGASFDDRPHIQWPGYVSGAELRSFRSLCLGLGEPEGRRHVWRILDEERGLAAWQQANSNLHATLQLLDFTPGDRSVA